MVCALTMSQQFDAPLLQLLLAAQEKGEPVALATIVRDRGSVPRRAGSKMLVYADGRIQATIGGGEMESLVIREALAALQDGRTRLIPYALVDPSRGDPGVCGGEVEIFVEPYLPPPTVFVIGCGHVGQAVAHLAHWLGFRVVVNDDRAELAAPAATPGADLYLPGSLAEGLTHFAITNQTYIAVLTRNIGLDREILPQLVETPAPYIGVIGSRRRWQETRRLLLADGLPEAQLNRFHSPIGLEIKAETPAEIAVSIMAEIIKRSREK
jgi:xanthine dehydrogenase accessory factor